ncbi:MAG: LVIVD repeat-containing protein [Candidatus Kariarchaeaceae archaeon]
MKTRSLTSFLQLSIIIFTLMFSYMNQIGETSSVVGLIESKNESQQTYYPHLIGDIQIGRTHEVFIDNDYAYVTTNQELVIIDISNRSIPKKISEIKMEGFAPVAIVRDELAYIVNMASHEFLIANVSNPENPDIIGEYSPDVDWENFNDLMIKLTLVDNYLYILSNALGLMIFNIQDPTNPILIGELNTGDYNAGMAITEDVLFYTNAEIGIKVLNIANRSGPYQIASLDMERGVFDLEIHEEILYVSNYFFGVIILNVSDPLNPRVISSLGETPDEDDPPRSRAVSGDNTFLAIAKMERGVSFVDVSDPTNPYELALYNETRPTNCLYDGKYVYITDSDTSRSFQIVEFITEEPLKDTQNHWYFIELVSILFLVIITVTSFLLIIRSKFFRKS